MRIPSFAGTFYPDTKKELLSELNLLFREKTEYYNNALGIIVPHAGYIYSGKVAAKTYKAISGISKRRFVILGVDHSGFNIVATSKLDWLTPLGITKNDKEFVNKLIKENSVIRNETAMMEEHSIEVQLPFLQYIFKDFKFAPIQLPVLSYKKILELRDILISEDHFFIASSDFTHYGINYQFVPRESFQNPLDYVKKLDEEIIKIILEFDGKKFYDFIVQKNLTVCGFIPIALLLEITKKLGGKKIKKICYDTSFSSSGDISNIVGYSGLIIY